MTRLIGRGVVCALLVVDAGCAVPVSDVCTRYVTCQALVDSTVDTSAYREGGACWAAPPQARVCDDQCAEALAALLATPDVPAECVP